MSLLSSTTCSYVSDDTSMDTSAAMCGIVLMVVRLPSISNVRDSNDSDRLSTSILLRLYIATIIVVYFVTHDPADRPTLTNVLCTLEE